MCYAATTVCVLRAGRRSKSHPRRTSNGVIVKGVWLQSFSSWRAHLRRAKGNDACKRHDRCRFLSLESGESGLASRSTTWAWSEPYPPNRYKVTPMFEHSATTGTNAALAYKFWLARCFRDGSPEEDSQVALKCWRGLPGSQPAGNRQERL